MELFMKMIYFTVLRRLKNYNVLATCLHVKKFAYQLYLLIQTYQFHKIKSKRNLIQFLLQMIFESYQTYLIL